MTPPASMADTPEMRDARDTIVAGGASIAATLAGMYWVMRTGFPNPVAAVLEPLGIALFLLAAPAFLRTHVSGRRAWWKGQGSVTIALLVLTVLPGAFFDESARVAGPIFAIAGLLLALTVLARWVRSGSVLSSVRFVAGTGVFAVWLGGVVWATRYKMPLFWETISFRGNVHHDPLYMTAIANMLDTYGVPSTGLDGLPVAKYHFGSGWMLTQWAELTGTDGLSFYSLGYAVIIIPLFFAAVLLLAVELRKAFGGNGKPRQLRSDWTIWATLAVAVIGVIPNDALDALAVWNGHTMLSESYLVGLVLFLLLFSVLASFRESAASETVTSATIFFVLFAPIALAATGLLKVSLMILLLAVMMYLIFRLGLWRRVPVVAGVVLSLASVAITYSMVALPQHNTGISPFNFMRYQVADGWQQFFPLFHLLLTWVYLGARLWEERIGDWPSLRVALVERRLLDVEILLVVALLGFVPGEVISIHGGSAVYFSDVQRWLGLAFILARTGRWVSEWRLRRSAADDRPRDSGIAALRLSSVLAVFIAGPFVVTLVFNTMQWPLRAFRSNVELRRELVAKAKGGGSATANGSEIADPALLAEGLRLSTYYPIVAALRNISTLPSRDRQRTALFIPQSVTRFYDMWSADDRCTFTPLVAPAIASVALIDGMPAVDCELTDQYNMTAYRPRTSVQLPADTSDAAVCQKARAAGFEQVIIMDDSIVAGSTPRTIHCGHNAGSSPAAGGGPS